MGVMEQQLWGCRFKNPVIAASGTFGFGEEYQNFYDISILGGISTKGMTLEPRDGNSGLRIIETPSGVMNSIGLQNPESFIIRNVRAGFWQKKTSLFLRMSAVPLWSPISKPYRSWKRRIRKKE